MLNKISFLLGFFVITCTFLIQGCSRSDDEPKSSSTDEECHITIEQLYGTWIITGCTIDPPVDLGKGPVSNIYETWDACRQDDTEQLLSNGNFIADEGDMVCPDTLYMTGTWDYDPGNCRVSIFIDSQASRVWKVRSASPTELVVNMNVRINDKDYVQTRTYKRY